MKKAFITVALCIAVVIYLFAQNKTKAVQSKAKPTPAAAQSSSAAGKDVYQKYCMACHQKDGGGVPRLNPPLIKTTYVLGDKTRLIQIALKGMNQPIEVEGEEYTNAMASFAHLTDQQIAGVLTYVRSSFGNKASAITPAEVKAVRAKSK
jgi:mono/diheme cytochrome c family protein